jgi:hypothetical protein
VWNNLSTEQIKTGKNAEGVPYLTLFLQDYTQRFKPTEPLFPNCGKCLNTYIQKYKNYTPMEKIKSKYKLKLMFEGITLFGTGLVITNETLTDEIGEQLLNEHPHGVALFDEIPKKVVKEASVIEPLKKTKK